MENALKWKEWQRIWVYKTFEIQIQKVDQIIKTFCKIGSLQDIWSRLFNM